MKKVVALLLLFLYSGSLTPIHSKDFFVKLYHEKNPAKAYGGRTTSENPSATKSMVSNDDKTMKLYRKENSAKAYGPPITKPRVSDDSQTMNLYRQENSAKAYRGGSPGKKPIMVHSSASEHNITVYYEINDMREGRELLLVFADQYPEKLLGKSPLSPIEGKWWLNDTSCHISSSKGEVRGCVDSFESMSEFVKSMTKQKKMKVLVTPRGKLQVYKVAGEVKTVSRLATACHKQTFGTPFAVYLCHMVPETEVQIVPLVGADGSNTNALTMCHHNTSEWDSNSIIFKVLNTLPGTPVCHFMTTDDMVWVP